MIVSSAEKTFYKLRHCTFRSRSEKYKYGRRATTERAFLNSLNSDFNRRMIAEALRSRDSEETCFLTNVFSLLKANMPVKIERRTLWNKAQEIDFLRDFEKGGLEMINGDDLRSQSLPIPNTRHPFANIYGPNRHLPFGELSIIQCLENFPSSLKTQYQRHRILRERIWEAVKQWAAEHQISVTNKDQYSLLIIPDLGFVIHSTIWNYTPLGYILFDAITEQPISPWRDSRGGLTIPNHNHSTVNDQEIDSILNDLNFRRMYIHGKEIPILYPDSIRNTYLEKKVIGNFVFSPVAMTKANYSLTYLRESTTTERSIKKQ